VTWTKGSPATRKPLRLKPDYAEAHNNLGNALRQKGQLDEAIAEYREALRLKKDFAEAHCNLGQALLLKGQFRQAVEEYRLGHELGSHNRRWPYPSAQWVRQAEQLAELDGRLLAVLEGKGQPKDATERLGFASLCQQHRQRYAAAARLFDEAFAAQPALVENLASGHRYNAACAAALAGCGQGKDTPAPDDRERTRLRRQAFEWLRADLTAWKRQLENEPEEARPAVAKTLQHWQQDADFAGVRGAEALGRLPEAERNAWQQLWQDVESLRRQAAREPQPSPVENKGVLPSRE
jgi:eukaryotic-like serine/threonine-protein kinase